MNDRDSPQINQQIVESAFRKQVLNICQTFINQTKTSERFYDEKKQVEAVFNLSH